MIALSEASLTPPDTSWRRDLNKALTTTHLSLSDKLQILDSSLKSSLDGKIYARAYYETILDAIPPLLNVNKVSE